MLKNNIKEEITYISSYDSILGKIIMASDSQYLNGLWFKDQKYYKATIKGKEVIKELDIFKQVKEWLDIYFSGQEPSFIPDIAIKTTPFRQMVIDIMLKIPYGKTISYKDIASIIEAKNNIPKMSARAVGSAVGHNPISIIVPCHRVIGNNGKLIGYAAGIDRKRKLLELEKVKIV